MKLIGLEKWQITSNKCYFLIRFLGTPFFHLVVSRAQATTSDISMLIDSETILLPASMTATLGLIVFKGLPR
jgi:hypothetical protein